MQIVSPDNPLFMFGGFHFGKRLRQGEGEAPPWIVAWICNNYWTTNFRASQPGPFRQRYVVVPHSLSPAQMPTSTGKPPAFETDRDDAVLHATADDILTDVALHPIPRPQQGRLPSEGSFFDMELNEVRFIGMKDAADGDGGIARFQNTARTSQDISIRPGLFTFSEAWECDAVENNVKAHAVGEEGVTVTIRPGAVMTVKLR